MKASVKARTKRKSPRSTRLSSQKLSEKIIQCILDKKGYDVVRLNLKKLRSSLADYFVICSCDSDTQAKAIMDFIRQTTEDSFKEKPWHTEGTENLQWVLMDYVNVVVHVFYRPVRNIYRIEELWGDAESEKFE